MITPYSRYIVLLICLLTTLPAWSSSQFSNMYVFGDSLSDTGNLASITQPLPAPFFENRITNGPNSIDILAQQFELTADASLHLIGPALGTNYAVAGARASGEEAIDLTTQVNAFLLNVANVAPADALYVVFIGGNDVRDARDTSSIRIAIQTITNAVEQEEKQIQKLIDAGARHIVVYNLPDVGRIPDTAIAAQTANDDRLIRRTTGYTRLYNILLRLRLRILEVKNNIDIIKFNSFKEFNTLFDNPLDFGFTNTTEACFSQITFTFHVDCNFGANFNQFVFFDEIHPTARAYALVGNIAAQVIREQLDKNEQDDPEDYIEASYKPKLWH